MANAWRVAEYIADTRGARRRGPTWPSAEADRGTPLDQQARERFMTYVVRSRPVVLRPDRRRPNPVVEQVRLELIDDARTDLPQLEVPAAAEQVLISDRRVRRTSIACRTYALRPQLAPSALAHAIASSTRARTA